MSSVGTRVKSIADEGAGKAALVPMSREVRHANTGEVLASVGQCNP
jgi:hypothetical protein